MFYIACTRFNNTTYNENLCYRKKYDENVIYGTTLKIRNIYPIGSLIFVAEMNNETNKIEGIGLIKNSLVCDKKHKIYDNSEYNHYIYRGKYWLSRQQINETDSEILEIFDNILFKGKSHLKCRIGITIITEKLFVHWIYKLEELKQKIHVLFTYHFKRHINEELAEETKEEYIEIIPKKRRKNKHKTNLNI